MDDEKYIVILKDILIKHSIERLFGCFNKDIYDNFPIIDIDGKKLKDISIFIVLFYVTYNYH